MADRYTLRLSTPPTGDPSLQPVFQDIDINPSILSLSWAEGVLGGYLGCVIRMREEIGMPIMVWEPLFPGIRGFLHAEIWWNGIAKVYEGRLMAISGEGKYLTEIELEGYGVTAVHDNYNDQSTGPASLSSGQLLKTLLVRYAPAIQVTNDPQYWVDPQITHSLGTFEYYKRTPGEAIDEVLVEGNTEGDALSFMVGNDRIAMLRPMPVEIREPTYNIAYDGSRVRWHKDWRNVYGGVTVEYGTAATVAGVEQLTGKYAELVYQEIQTRRSRLLAVGEIQSASAVSLQRAEELRSSRPEVSYDITVGSEGLERYGTKMFTPPQLIRPYETIQVGEDMPRYILSKNVDTASQSITLEVGSPVPDFAKNFFGKYVTNLTRIGRFLTPQGVGRLR